MNSKEEKEQKISGEVYNLIGLGIDFRTELTKREEKSCKEKIVKEIITKDNIAAKDLKDIFCMVCGAEVDLDSLSCEGCGMEFNMDEKEARHMISLMAGVFWADGVMDEAEKECLTEYIKKIEISTKTKSKLNKELRKPRKLKNIVRWIKSDEAKRNTLRMAVASGMVSQLNEAELKYLEEAKKLLNIDPEEANDVMKRVEEYLRPLMY